MPEFTYSPDTTHLPVLPLRDVVGFPYMTIALQVGRDKSIHALEMAQKNHDNYVFLVTQKASTIDNPSTDDLYDVGVMGKIIQFVRLPDGTIRIVAQGLNRYRATHFKDADGYFSADIQRLDDQNKMAPDETDILLRTTLNAFEHCIKLNKKIPSEVIANISQITESDRLINSMIAHLTLKIGQKYELLVLDDVQLRLEKLLQFIEAETAVMNVEKKIRSRVNKQVEKNKRDFVLNEQLKAIQKELGDGSDDAREEITELEKKIKKTRMSKEAKTKAYAELKKLKSMSPMAPEGSVIRNYLDWLTSLPWSKNSRLIKDIQYADKILHEDHFGLDKVKERILEYLAVQQRVEKVKGTILCLVGPPGVGKTSLGRSIAKATGREYVRMALGGVRDESEIRGHRRTYIGSLPGKIIQNLKKAGTNNPLFLLDEIDKLGADWRGDPSAALLEVLDPEQNKAFNDHFIEVDYDLSSIMFICTANSLNMPRPLLDRMEIIRISGYTEDEKLGIVRRHILAKQIKENGLKKDEFAITDDAVRDLVRYYTREAGVRGLEREIANLCRKATTEILRNGKKQIRITAKNLNKYAGVRRFQFGEIEDQDGIGIVTGLAWTEVGGELLTIEAVTLPGKGRLSMTGKLGDVMKESIQAAEMLVKSRATLLGIPNDIFETRDIHLHIPEGATPKDGPSAGVAMVTTIVSVLTHTPIRRDIAMTGEISLRGRVLPIGGLKEKLLAALRGGIKTVLIPADNEKDLEDIPENVKKNLTIIPVRLIEEVLAHALTTPIVPLTETKMVVDDIAQDVSPGDGHEGHLRLPH